jgi:hypothetical protein
MSKRCELQKEYYQAKGNYKGSGKYSDDYVMWLEEQVLALRIQDVSGSLLDDKWKQYRNITNNEDAWCFKEWLKSNDR